MTLKQQSFDVRNVKKNIELNIKIYIPKPTIMKIGEQTKHFISKSIRRRHMKDTQEVVYKTYLGKHNGKALFSSTTKHELI